VKRIEITRAAVLGLGKHGKVGEVLEVEDSVARVLVNNKQARVAPAPAVPVEPAEHKAPEKKGK
jgi:hypothetical protein